MLSVVTVIVVSIVVGANVGAHPTSSRHRIIGGQDASIEEYPYQVAIETEYETFFCGGIIISDKVILTAAHPFYEKNDETESYCARVGSSLREKDGRIYCFAPEQIKIHPNFAGIQTHYDYDVAVIILNESIKLDLTADKIPLVPVGTTIKDGEDLIVTGFGEISFAHAKPEKLQVGVIPKLAPEACTKLADAKVTDRMLCAGNGKPTTYLGDSGGPLTTAKGRQLVGIVSWGKKEPGEKDPVVFTNIANQEIHDFITKNSS